MLSKQVEPANDAETVRALSTVSAFTDSGEVSYDFGHAGPEAGDDDDIADIEDDYDDESFELA